MARDDFVFESEGRACLLTVLIASEVGDGPRQYSIEKGTGWWQTAGDRPATVEDVAKVLAEDPEIHDAVMRRVAELKRGV